MTNEQPTERNKSPWGGRIAALLILGFVVVVLALMFFAVRGPR